LEGDGSHQTAAVRFQFKLTSQEQENIRWYLEDYLQYLSDPAPQIAAKVEKRMTELGSELFKAVFQTDDDARTLWTTLHQNLNNTRVEILPDITQATAIPWELLHNPEADTFLALQSLSFVRVHSQVHSQISQRSRLPQADGNVIRILLIICRPQGRDDVPFRSVASRLIKGLGNRPDEFQLDVLRPPTFQQLTNVLQSAKAEGKPYQIVHFDGHGVFLDVIAKTSGTIPDPGNMRGYLMFENSDYQKNQELIHGKLLGKVLVNADVSLLILNACRSAHAEALEQPAQIDMDMDNEQSNSQTRVRAFGSLAQEVMNAGMAGVVAMRYNVYVMTAAQFVADLYGSLVQGRTLGEAVTVGRQQLQEQPQREVAYKPVELQDWLVPVVYEAEPIALFPTPIDAPKLNITLHENDALPTTGMLDAQLPKTPDVGFFGRDETLLAIDRAFDHHAIVLLHAFAGSGKTSTAAEFGRWYALTGGLLKDGKQGHVLFTSFQRYLPLSRVLDKLGQIFERDFERSGIHWLTLDDAQRRTVALQVLSQVPVLWIWDNVEPVAGFPDGETQRWSEIEQQELVDFLRDARDTKAKFLLTSRRDERAWLGDLPARIEVPPMPMQERIQLARVLAEKYGHCLTEVEDWRPLLRYTQGNPLTITALVSQALRDELRTKQQIEDFVLLLQAGEAEINDNENEGRSKSLGASLSYGLSTFNETEQQQLSLLHLFQDFVQVGVLQGMGEPREVWCLPIIRGLTREQGIALLDRAAEVGLLTSLGEGYYAIHPVLPWYFKRLFDSHHSNVAIAAQDLPIRAFVGVMSRLGDYYLTEYGNGRLDVLWLLMEEANFLNAYQLAKTNSWWSDLIGTLQGLQGLYDHIGRTAEWVRLAKEVIPIFVDLDTNEPRTELEEDWSIVTGYRIKLAKREKQWEQVEQLLKVKLDWEHKAATSAIALSPKVLDNKQRNKICTLALSLGQFSDFLREQGKSDCVRFYKEGIQLCQRITEPQLEAILTFNLGHAFKDISNLRSLEQAEQCYLRSLDLVDKNDYLGRSRCLSQLGLVARERFKEALASHQPLSILRYHLNNARNFYCQAICISPSNAINHLAVLHTVLGRIYGDAGDFKQALSHSQEAVNYYEIEGNRNDAAKVRRDIAIILARSNRLNDALLYAQAALQNFAADINRDATEIEATHHLITKLQQSLATEGS
jgi:tetratricopeptide (TPR) repeat protein